MLRSYPAAALLACLAVPPSASAADSCERYADELAAMAGAGQALRKRIDHLDVGSRTQLKLRDHILLVDRVNTEHLKALMARCGWPSTGAHGARAVKDAWLLVQHAERDLAFQKQVLDLIGQAAAAGGEGPDQSFAYLYDRIAVAEKRPQRYGTQLSAPTNIYCALEFDPMDDRAQVEARRAQLGMGPLDAYRRMALELQRCPVPPQHPSDYHYAPPALQGMAPQADIRRK